jgi:hypothetical protein
LKRLAPPPDATHVEVVAKDTHRTMWAGTREKFMKDFMGGLDEDNQKSYTLISYK